MEILKSSETPKPKFVSEVVEKTRPELRVVSLAGKGDPMKTFDKKLAQVVSWLKTRGVKPAEAPTLGIYYKNRAAVGVENVEWDACVPVERSIETEGDIRFQVLPKRRVISVTLTGSYNLIGTALDYLEQVALTNEINIKRPLIEIYLKEGEIPVTELQYFVEERK